MSSAVWTSSQPRSRIASFFTFVRDELAPYPERGAITARVAIGAVIMLFLVMVFRLPDAVVGCYYVLLIARVRSGPALRTLIIPVLTYSAGLAIFVLGMVVFGNSDLLRFVWLVFLLFCVFFFLRTFENYSAGGGFSFMIAASIPFWERPFSAAANVTDSLWLAFGVGVGTTVAVAVRTVANSFGPRDELLGGIDTRLQAVQRLFEAYANQSADVTRLRKGLEKLAMVGTGGLRRMLLKRANGRASDQEQTARLGALVALIDRLVDVTAHLSSLEVYPTERERIRARAIVNRCSAIREAIVQGGDLRFPIEQTNEEPSTGIPLLPEVEQTLILIIEAHSASEPSPRGVAAMTRAAQHSRLFIADAFSNPDHIRFAIKGCLATVLCYLVYLGIDWPGTMTCIATCMITALSTVGSSRQKQFLRFGGALAGGAIGMVCQVLLFPQMDTIVPFTIVYATVSAVAAWIALSSPRFSYFGLQIGYAFNCVTLYDFGAPTSLAMARDRVAGILIGLLAMWVVFDNVWPTPAIKEMTRILALNCRLLARLARIPRSSDHEARIDEFSALRERISAGFSSISAYADTVRFEVGKDQAAHMSEREQVLRSQAIAETLFLNLLALDQIRRGENEAPSKADTCQRLCEQTGHALDLISEIIEDPSPATFQKVDQSIFQAQEELGREFSSSLPNPGHEVGSSIARQTVALLRSLSNDHRNQPIRLRMSNHLQMRQERIYVRPSIQQRGS
jgi:multidrug resistance protein MdtO